MTSNKNLISQTLARRMMTCIEEYERIKKKESIVFKTVKDFCKYNNFSHQNFMKIYHRYKQNPNLYSLIPQKRGPKYKIKRTDINIENRIIELRKKEIIVLIFKIYCMMNLKHLHPVIQQYTISVKNTD